MMTSNHFDACDESKCVSRGRSDLFDGFFTCYGSVDDSIFPKMCSDGFLPALVESEPPLLASHWMGDVPVNYFTCCPPQLTLSPTNVNATPARHCSDPIIRNDTMKDTSICDDQGDRIFAQPRLGARIERNRVNPWFRNVTFLDSESPICCDSTPTDRGGGSNGLDSASNASNVFNHSECVPYRNVYYEEARAVNTPMTITTIHCNITDFPFPRPIDGEDHVTSTGLFQCCKNGPAMPPYVEDMEFKITMYTNLIFYGIMAVVSAILVAAMLSPLLMQSKRKKYNVYNLFVLNVGVIDLIHATHMVTEYGLGLRQQKTRLLPSFTLPEGTEDGYLLWPVPDTMYMLGNMIFNCLMCYEIWVMLKSSRNAIRIKPPSWTNINLKILAIYSFVILFAVVETLVRKAARRVYYDGNVEKSFRMRDPLSYFTTGMIYTCFLYVLITSILVWCRGYIPKATGTSPRDKALRELSIYFFRIVWVFLGGWVPKSVLFLYSSYVGSYWLPILLALITPLQSIVTFCVLLTKSDVRQYIVDLLTLSYLDCSCVMKANGANDEKDLAKKPPNRVAEVSNITATTVENTSSGSKLVESRVSNDNTIVRNSKEGETTDDVCDEETGVGRSYSKQTTRRSLRVLATGDVVA